jgi:hypothetical protein
MDDSNALIDEDVEWVCRVDCTIFYRAGDWLLDACKVCCSRLAASLAMEEP